MNDPVIAVRNIGKLYRIYSRPQDRLKQMLLWRLGKRYGRDFWALREVSFAIQQGETVGIVGRNGSGKSTLLQIIAGTLAPTTGEVRVRGRVAALLELGSGFNPEFSGRENVFMSGAILGLSRAEMEARFAEIAAFADIGEFIDQPLKLYSSGMMMRLAFAVQALVAKDILIVDEALAVGDEAFQRKCMVALEQFRDQGGTVLLVSHAIQTIVRHCDRCLLLAQGRLLADGPAKPVTDLYQKLIYSDPREAQAIVAEFHRQGAQRGAGAPDLAAQGKVATRRPAQDARFEPEVADWFDPNMPQPDEVSYGNGAAEIVEYGVYNQRGERVNILVAGRRYTWSYRVLFHRDAYQLHFGMMLKIKDGVEVASVSSARERVSIDHIPAHATVDVSFSLQMNVVPDTYFLNAGVGSGFGDDFTYLHRRVDICMIRVIGSDSREHGGIAYMAPHFSVAYAEASETIGPKAELMEWDRS